MGAIGTAATVASTGISAYASYRNAAMAQQVAERNAKEQDKAALQAIEQGQQESDRQRAAGARLLAEQRVGMAANGLDLSGGNALEVLTDTGRLVEQDAFAIRENARRGAGQMAVGAANSRADAMSARSEKFFGPATSLLSGAAKVGNRYASWAAPQPGALPTYQ